MKRILLFGCLLSLTATGYGQTGSAKFELQKKSRLLNTIQLGTYYETEFGPFKGCVLYLQGFGDSIRNHQPLFRALSESGYRIVTFDYLGQGGSSGSMDRTRLSSIVPGFTIGDQAKWVWDLAVQAPDRYFGRTCANSPKLVIGWSTGGLAAYKLAFEKWADAVVLITPGIHWKSKSSLFFKAPAFATNLFVTSYRSQNWKIPSHVKGLVFLSGENDTYVDSSKVRNTLGRNAPHFQRVLVPNALHEIDNEVPAIAQGLQKRVVNFLDDIMIPRLISRTQ